MRIRDIITELDLKDLAADQEAEWEAEGTESEQQPPEDFILALISYLTDFVRSMSADQQQHIDKMFKPHLKPLSKSCYMFRSIVLPDRKSINPAGNFWKHDTISFDTYTSLSGNSHFALERMLDSDHGDDSKVFVMLYIDVLAGTPVIEVNDYLDVIMDDYGWSTNLDPDCENEVIFPPGVKFKVKSRKQLKTDWNKDNRYSDNPKAEAWEIELEQVK